MSILICVITLLRTVVTKIKHIVRCILDRQCIGRLGFDRMHMQYIHNIYCNIFFDSRSCNEAVLLHRVTLSDITQTLRCFDDCSDVSVIEQASTKVLLSAGRSKFGGDQPKKWHNCGCRMRNMEEPKRYCERNKSSLKNGSRFCCVTIN
jgi:hypothetical protein